MSGRLRVGVIPTVAPYLLPQLAPELRKRYPKLTLLWTEEKTELLVQRLAHGDLDAAILALEADIGELEKVILGQDTFVFAAAPSHPLATSSRPLKADELEDEPVLLLDEGHCFRKQYLAGTSSPRWSSPCSMPTDRGNCRTKASGAGSRRSRARFACAPMFRSRARIVPTWCKRSIKWR